MATQNPYPQPSGASTGKLQDQWGRMPGDPQYGQAPTGLGGQASPQTPTTPKAGQDTTSPSPYPNQPNTAPGINPSTGLPYGSTDQPGVGGGGAVDPNTGLPNPTPPGSTNPSGPMIVPRGGNLGDPLPPASTPPPAASTSTDPGAGVPIPSGSSDQQVADYLRALMASGLAPQAAIDIANKNLDLKYGSSPAYYPGTNTIGLTNFYMDGGSGWGNVNRGPEGPAVPTAPASTPVTAAPTPASPDAAAPSGDTMPTQTSAPDNATPTESSALYMSLLDRGGPKSPTAPGAASSPATGLYSTGGPTDPTVGANLQNSGSQMPAPGTAAPAPAVATTPPANPAMPLQTSAATPVSTSSPNEGVPHPAAAGANPVTPAGTVNQSLYDQLVARAQQSLNIDPHDPIIANQVNAYDARQQQAARRGLAATAERQGPMGNLSQENRLANEQIGQSTSTFQAQLMQNELQARRSEISQALTQQQAYLTDEQKMKLQQQLAELDNALEYARLHESGRQFDVGNAQRAYEFDTTNQTNIAGL